VILEPPRDWPPAEHAAPLAAAGPLARAQQPVVRHTYVAQDTVRGDSAHRIARVHPPGFEKTHRTSAVNGALTCTGCHTQRYCADCHAGEGRRRFHVTNFVSRHAADSYARERDCASCHNTEAFCKTCHQSVGLGATGRRRVAFHTAQPNWLLQHGRAARQGLQSCTTCHLQQDCMQCHSQAGFGVSPHGPDFDAKRMASHNRQICLACHFRDPTGRS
jgi:hypothetical protein